MMNSLPELNPAAQWDSYTYPFRHVRASNVFGTTVYATLESAFAGIRDQAADRRPSMRRSAPGYDALIASMRQDLALKFVPLFERRWIRFLARLFDLPDVPIVDGGLHHVPRNSRSGWVHNDFCSAWFDGTPSADGLLFADRNRCEYFTGRKKAPDAQPREYVRAATVIFYLLNDGWNPGFGGETGLYSSVRADIGPVDTMPPLNNSMLLFECSPHSYHRLLANPGAARNSIILWLHFGVEDALARWGDAVTRRRT